jgi:serine/threonine protein kinase
MGTGQLPFEGEIPLIIALKHKSENPQDPMELNPQIPANLSQLILKCLAKEKEERPQSASQFSTELSGIDAGIPTTQKEIAKKKPLTSATYASPI